MKKLMVMAAVMGLGFAAQATAWFQASSLSGVLYNGKGSGSSSALGDWSVYMLAIDSAGGGDWETIAGSVVSAFREGTISQSSITKHSSYVATLTTVSEGYKKGRIISQVVAYEDGTTSEENGFFAVAFNGDAIYIGDESWETGGADENNPTSLKLEVKSSDENFANDDFSNSGWYTKSIEDVPEPTSGMLMLIGLAGLALRRKRS